MRTQIATLLAASSLVSAGLIKRDDDNSTVSISDADLAAAAQLLATTSSGNSTDVVEIQQTASNAVAQALSVPDVIVAAAINNQSISASNATTVTVLTSTVNAVNSNVTSGTVLAASNTVSKRSLWARFWKRLNTATTQTTQGTSNAHPNTIDVGNVDYTDSKIVHPTLVVPSGYTTKWGPLNQALNAPADFLGGYAYPSLDACAAQCNSISNCAGFNGYLFYNDVPGNDASIDFQTEQDQTTGAIYGSLRCAFYASTYDSTFATNYGAGTYANGPTFITDSYFFSRNNYVPKFSCPADMTKTYGPQTGSNQATSGYMGVAALSSYDVAACEQICKSALPDANSGPCNYINIFTQRDANGNVLNHMCALYSYIQDASNANNYGATDAIGCKLNTPRFMLKAMTKNAVLANNKDFWFRIFSNYDSAGTYLAQWDNQVGASTIFELIAGKFKVVSGECTGCTVIQEPCHIINLGPTNTATDGASVTNQESYVRNSIVLSYFFNFVELVSTPWGVGPRPSYGNDKAYPGNYGPIAVAAVGYKQNLNLN